MDFFFLPQIQAVGEVSFKSQVAQFFPLNLQKQTQSHGTCVLMPPF